MRSSSRRARGHGRAQPDFQPPCGAGLGRNLALWPRSMERGQADRYAADLRAAMERLLHYPRLGTDRAGAPRSHGLPASLALTCPWRISRPYALRESGGRCRRQPGQVRKEAATTISRWVVPAPTARFGASARNLRFDSNKRGRPAAGRDGRTDGAASPRRSLSPQQPGRRTFRCPTRPPMGHDRGAMARTRFQLCSCRATPKVQADFFSPRGYEESEKSGRRSCR